MVFRHLCSTTSRAICVVLLFFFLYLESDMIFKGLEQTRSVYICFDFFDFLCKLSELKSKKRAMEKIFFG